MTPEQRKAFVCLGCGQNTSDMDEYYMVYDDVWLKAHPKRDGMLCVGCLENRLGRELNGTDFTRAPINCGIFFGQSERLRERLDRNPQR
jgi:hypothetical protein